MLDSLFAPPGTAGLALHGVAAAGLESLLAALPPAQARFATAAGFRARPGEIALLPGEAGLDAALFGLPDDAANPYPYGALAGLPAGTWRLASGFAEPAACVLGFALGAYRFERLKSSPEPRPAPILVLPDAAQRPALSAARATWRVRDLVNMPANLLGPAALAQAAEAALREAAGGGGLTVRQVTGAALQAGYPAIAAVGEGAARPPVVLEAEWTGPGADSGPVVAICGKGVCFDTGGLDLKPATGMLRMKKDMAGAAAALGLACMIVEAGLKLRLILRLGCVENSISARAMRPLDVIRTRKGLNVEIGNTDAEGRLVLADLLAESCEHGAGLLIDFATLTGAARVALGPDLPAFFCNDDALASRFCEIAGKTHDPAWRLPLWHGYNLYLDSHVADLNNVSAAPHAGAVVAALFLERFVSGGAKWLHLDVYGWNETGRPGRPEGGEAQGMRGAFALISGWGDVAPELKETISDAKRT